MIVGPCQYGTERPQVADRGTDSNFEGSCKCIEETVGNSRQEVVFQVGGLGEVIATTHHNVSCYETKNWRLEPGLILWYDLSKAK